MKSKEVFIGKIGVSILFTIGSHAEENFAMIDASKKEDIWFHVHKITGIK